MKTTPQTEEQIERESLVPEGIHEFQVVAAEECLSKGGNAMIKLSLEIDHEDTTFKLNDYLVSCDAGMAKMKIHRFATAVGLEDEYQAGEIEDYKCEGKIGYAEIEHKKSKGYDLQAVVSSYLSPKAALILRNGSTAEVPTPEAPTAEETAKEVETLEKETKENPDVPF